ncbi:hypothetical protein R5R35_012005 [Gryllus longicercus]|uniref:Toll-like receptor n=1 Tax=Gryllus longicercus TaxID=2509291 RepID=A0AAN9VRI5_9ORTH
MYTFVVLFMLMKGTESSECTCDYGSKTIICSGLRLRALQGNTAFCGLARKIDLSQNYIRKFPGDIHQFLFVDLSRNSLEDLNVSSVHKVKELNVSTNILTVINLRNLFLSLTGLDASKNNLGLLNDDFLQGHCNILQLDISDNKIVSLQSIARCQQLIALIAARNIITKVTDDLLLLTKLKLLNLSENKLKIIANLPVSLEMLNLSWNKLAWMSSLTLIGLQSLKVLHLEKNEMNFIRDGMFANLSSLSTLNMNDNNISFLYKNSFIGLRAVKKLQLRHNFIEYVSNMTFSDLPALEELYLDWNLLTSLPALRLGRNVKRVSITLNLIKQVDLPALLTMLPEDSGSREVFFLVNNIRGDDIEWPKIMQHFDWQCVPEWVVPTEELISDAMAEDRIYTLARAECPCVRFFQDDRAFGTCISSEGVVLGMPWLQAAQLMATLEEEPGGSVVIVKDEL